MGYAAVQIYVAAVAMYVTGSCYAKRFSRESAATHQQAAVKTGSKGRHGQVLLCCCKAGIQAKATEAEEYGHAQAVSRERDQFLPVALLHILGQAGSARGTREQGCVCAYTESHLQQALHHPPPSLPRQRQSRERAFPRLGQ